MKMNTTQTNVKIVTYTRAAYYSWQKRDWSGKIVTETIPGDELEVVFYAMLPDGTLRPATPWEKMNYNGWK